MGLYIVRDLTDGHATWVTIESYFVAVGHVLETDIPNRRETCVNPLAVAICKERRHTLVEDLSKLVRGFHRHYVLAGPAKFLHQLRLLQA